MYKYSTCRYVCTCTLAKVGLFQQFLKPDEISFKCNCSWWTTYAAPELLRSSVIKTLYPEVLTLKRGITSKIWELKRCTKSTNWSDTNAIAVGQHDPRAEAETPALWPGLFYYIFLALPFPCKPVDWMRRQRSPWWERLIEKGPHTPARHRATPSSPSRVLGSGFRSQRWALLSAHAQRESLPVVILAKRENIWYG